MDKNTLERIERVARLRRRPNRSESICKIRKW